MQIYILLTDNCNLNCEMCIRGRQVGTDLDLEQLKNKEFLISLKNHDLVLTGGEPTLHRDFEKILEVMTTHAKTVTVTTNGTTNFYIKKELFKDNLFFQISVDGDQIAHDKIRGIGTYKKTMKTIRLFDDYSAQYSVASVVNKKNADSMKRLETVLRELYSIRYWRLSYEMPFGSAGFEDMMTAEDWNEFVDDILDSARLRVRIKKIFPFEIYDKRKHELNEIYLKNRLNNCGSSKSKIYVYPDLEVYSCTCLSDFSLGNLGKEPLEKILCGEKIEAFKNYECVNAICKECQYFLYCNGGCIGMSYHYFGKLGMGDIRCPILREKLS